MTHPHTIVLADDHPLIQVGLRDLLSREPGLEFVGCATNGDDALHLAQRLRPDLLILDLHMPGLTALAVITAVHEHSPQTKVIVMSDVEAPLTVQQLCDARIDGYVLKEEAPDLVVHAIRNVLKGATWFSHAVFREGTSRRGSPPTARDRWHGLSERQHTLLRYLGEGLSNRQIARKMSLAEQTVHNYTVQLYTKLNVNSRAQAIIWLKSHADGQ